MSVTEVLFGIVLPLAFLGAGMCAIKFTSNKLFSRNPFLEPSNDME